MTPAATPPLPGLDAPRTRERLHVVPVGWQYAVKRPNGLLIEGRAVFDTEREAQDRARQG